MSKMSPVERCSRLLLMSVERSGLFAARVVLVVLGIWGASILAVAAMLAAVLLGLVGVLLLLCSLILLPVGRQTFSKLRAGAALRVLWRSAMPKADPPPGIPIPAGQAPALREMVREALESYRLRRISDIRIVSDRSLGLVPEEGRAFPGFRREYLVIGMQLLQSVSAEELEALLFQLLGLRRGIYSAFLRTIEPLAGFWGRLQDRIGAHWLAPHVARVATGLAGWTAPYGITLTILQTLDADRRAAEMVGPELVGRAIVQEMVAGAYLERVYWTGLAERGRSAVFPTDALAGAERALRHELDPGQGKIWLNEALAVGGVAVGGEVTLNARLGRLGVRGVFTEISSPSAAETLLDRALPEMLATLQKELAEQYDPIWKARYDRAMVARRKRVELEEKERSGSTLSTEELEQLAELVAAERGIDAAEPLYARILEANPAHPEARFALGRIGLARGEETGLGMIEGAIEERPSLVLEGVESMYAYLTGQRRFGDADALVARYREKSEGEIASRERQAEQARVERSQLRFNDVYEPHGLPEAQLARIRAHVARIPGVVEAYLIRKVLRLSTEPPLFVLGVLLRRPASRLFGESRERIDAENRIAADLAAFGEVRIVHLELDVNRPMLRVVRSVDGARFYPEPQAAGPVSRWRAGVGSVAARSAGAEPAAEESDDEGSDDKGSDGAS